jgi:hypothetical protein
MIPFLVTVLAATVIGTFASPTDAKSESDLRSVCELIKNWESYQDRVITIRAIYTEKVVQERLYDPSCLDLGQVAVEWPSHLPRSMKNAIGKLDKIVAKDPQNRAWVVIRATFHGPRPFTDDEIDSAIPQGIKEKLRKSHKRYGHMGTLDHMVQVTELLDVTEVAATEGSPFPL